MSPRRLTYAPPGATYVDGFDVAVTPMARNLYRRTRSSVQRWLNALTRAAAPVAARVQWGKKARYAAVIEIRIPWSGDVDNYLKDILDRSARQGIFGGNDERIDLVHATKLVNVPQKEVGARIEIWRLP